MYLAIDIGGTKTLLAVFDTDGDIKEKIKFPTPQDYAEFKTALIEAVKQLPKNEYLSATVGVRGNVDRENGLLKWDSILNWENAPIRDDCTEVLNCPVAIENDTKLAGLSEARLLGGKFSKVLYITISTGIGSAFIIDGDIDQAVSNSEIGKSVYEHDGKLVPWESYASGKAIVEKFGQRASEIEDPVIWRQVTDNLAPGFINASAVYTPDVIVVGGGVGTHLHKFAKELDESIASINHQGISVPPILQAKRPEDAVIYGCYEIARQKV